LPVGGVLAALREAGVAVRELNVIEVDLESYLST
jgi:hypothetical protein